MTKVLLVMVLLSASVQAWADSCVDCHADPLHMKSLGHEEFIVKPGDVAAQSGMAAACTDCHRGDSSSMDMKRAHADVLSVRAIRQKTWEPVARSAMQEDDRRGWRVLSPSGVKAATALMPKRLIGDRVAEHPDYRLVLLHDKNPATLAFNPGAASETCGRCHEDKVKGFLRSPMGGAPRAHTQSQYHYWTAPSGPQSCGLWVGELKQPAQAEFTDRYIKEYNDHSTRVLPANAAYSTQRTCNQCHVGCLDCHLDVRRPDGNPKNGAHTFVKTPSPVACYGGGRGFSCHAGPLERRRGDGYIRGEFTQAAEDGLDALKTQPDVHYTKGLSCVACHEPNATGGAHADLKRGVDCGRCHRQVVDMLRRGPHRKVDCAACHTSLIGGYAFNFWTAAGTKASENPITRIQDYVVAPVRPLLVKNPDGVWIPVHVVPHTSGNVKADEVRLSRKLIFRNRPDAAVDRRYRSNDSYAITGLARNVDELDRDVMVWLNLDRVAHATGRSRGCGSCHASRSQIIQVRYNGGSYRDVDDGEYAIKADREGLRVTDFRGAGGGPAASGLTPYKEKWQIKGDYSLPRIKRQKLYKQIETDYLSGRFSH